MRIFPLGDSAATIEFGNEVSVELNDRSIALATDLESDPFEGMIEAVPAYASVSIFFDKNVTSFASVKAILSRSAGAAAAERRYVSNLIEIPIVISGDTSADIARVAQFADIDEDAVLDLFFTRTYRVYMLGFLPGFAYMGEVDERIACPRLETPRSKVAKGSVGIAGKQTGIYPLESPGGWNIIGRTDRKMFDASADQPCLLKPGDEVRFVRC
ncbi:MAG: 5-oxoprolinase subunit PxpB [bacterium]|nr:5-oxoprolinase subunit PxpB [bacterium]